MVTIEILQGLCEIIVELKSYRPIAPVNKEGCEKLYQEGVINRIRIGDEFEYFADIKR